jgi:diguanylate cyclase (GGDEF)-like protein
VGPIGQLMTDPVTGAFTRAYLEPRLEEEIGRAARADRSCAVFLFDVDFFKTVNDVYGHLRGDEVLRQLADRVQSLVRRQDLLFRYGGDEFVLVLPEIERDEAVGLAERLTAEVKAGALPGEPPLQVSVSLGVASYPTDGADLRELLLCADRRNYLAKRRGRGRAVADDSETVTAAADSGRLWEREAALATVRDLLGELGSHGRGELVVAGERGAGHTRFLQEVGTVAALRGLLVLPVPPGPAPLLIPDEPARAGVLLLADLDAADGVGAAVAAAVAFAGDAPVGLVRAVLAGEPGNAGGLVGAAVRGGAGGAAGGAGVGLPVLGTVELTPWVPATLRIWLRASLHGEPSRILVNWLAGQCGGLPGRARRELDRLRRRGGLLPTEAGGWTLAPSVLDRPLRMVRLPAQLTELVGRGAELARVRELLAGTRLLTLAGPGGIGKTRLSLAAAAEVAEDYAEGTVFVPLAETASTDLVVAAIAQALRVAEAPGETPLAGVAAHLADAELLLVLDNFEQVLDAASIVDELLSAAPGLTVLVTSREPLSLYGEQVYRVPPLPLPDPAGGAAADSPAVALFEQRARAVDADFALTAQTLPVAAEICARLDGLPLAIELAAARVDEWTPAELLAALPGRLDDLGPGPRNRTRRQQTLTGAIAWSYDLLDPTLRALFTRLAVFAGGCTAEAAAAVCPDVPGIETALRSLTTKSLLTRGGDGRWGMLATIRSYALSTLDTEPDSAQARVRHAVWFTALAEQASGGLAGAEQAEWTERLDRDYPNLRAAMEWTLARGDTASTARICVGLWRYWRNGSQHTEGREWLDRVLRAPEPLPDGLRARLLHPAAVLAAARDDHAAAYRYGTEGLRLASAAGDRRTVAEARNALGIAAIGAGDYRLAAEHFGHSLAGWQELGEPRGIAAALGNLAKLSLRLSDVDAASGYVQRCLDVERGEGNVFGIVLGLETLARILILQGDADGARRACEESLERSRSIGDPFGEAMALHQLGLAAQLTGDRPAAAERLTSALARRHELNEREDLAISLDCVANLVAAGDPEFAVRLLAAADRLRERYKLPLPSESETHRAATTTTVRAALDEQHFSRAWSGGRSTPLDVIVEAALDLVPA